MEPFLEFEGKNIDNAIEKACNELKKHRDELKYDVISNGSSGIFGIVGAKKAKIRVSVPNTEDTRNKKNQRKDGIKTLVDEAFDDSEKEKTIKEKGKTAISDEIITEGKEKLQTIIDFITKDAVVTAEQKNGRLLLNVQGGQSAILIGKKGQNLDAIQYLIDKIINKKSEKKIRVQIDVEGYLEARQTNLEKLATRLADKAKNNGKPATIGQMNAHDRRIVHIALKNDKDVRTQSIGEGFYRKLVIFPKRKKNQKKEAAVE